MPVLDATSRKIRLVIGGVDFAQSLAESFVPRPSFDELSGVRLISGTFALVETLQTPESLDPYLNTRWVVGQPIDIEIADSAGVFRPHPGLGLRIFTVPTYSERDRTLQIEFACELGYRSESTPAADCTGIDPRIGLSRRQAIANLALVAGFPLAALSEVLSSPLTDLLNYPLQKFGGDSFIAQIGQLARDATPPHYVWSDNLRQLRISPLLNQPTIDLALDWQGVTDTERVNSAEYARPFEELKITSSKVTITPVIYPYSPPPDEQYATIGELFPDQPVFIGERDLLWLVLRNRQTETYDELAGIRELKSQYTRTNFQFFGLLGAGATRSFVATQYLAEETVETWRYHPRPAGWNSCRPELNPRSPAGLIREYERVVLGGDAIINGIVTNAGASDKGRPVFRELTQYFYDDRQNLVRQFSQRWVRLGQIGTSSIFQGQYVGLSLRYRLETTWAETAPMSGVWTKTEKVFAPGGKAENNVTVVNGVEALPSIDGQPVVEANSPPPAPETAPTGFTSSEVPIEALSLSPARGGGIATKRKSISLPFASSEAGLQNFADFLSALYWGRALGRRFTLPLLDPFLSPGYRPLQRWRYSDQFGVARDYRIEEALFALSPEDCLVSVEGALIGTVAPGGGVLPPNAPITIATGLIGLVGNAERAYPPLPILTAAGLIGFYGGEGVLRWAGLTEAEWIGLTASQLVEVI